MRILITEDEKSLACVLSETLSMEGYNEKICRTTGLSVWVVYQVQV